MHINDDDDDDDNFDGDVDNNNFNEAFSYQLIVYPIYAAMQSESVLWNAVIRRLLLSHKVPLLLNAFGQIATFLGTIKNLRYNLIRVSGRSRPRPRGRLRCYVA